MKLKNKNFIAPLAGLLLATAPAFAQAERVYFLVGERHAYRIGLDKYAHVQERENIEEGYADGVAADQKTYQEHVAAGGDPAQESAALNDDLNRLADERDAQLASLYQRDDSIRANYPELRPQVDGPYQVIGIGYTNPGVYTSFEVFAPWPGYAYTGGFYGGWHYGVVYQPSVFLNLYIGWGHSWGGGRYWGGFYGHNGYVAFHPRGYVFSAHGYGGPNFGGYQGRNYYHTEIQNHYSRTVINNYHFTNSRPVGGGFHGAATNRGSFGNRPAVHGGYGGAARMNAGHGSFGHAPATRPGGYGHVPGRTGGSFGHAPAAHVGGYGNAPARTGGSFSHAPAGHTSGYGHATPRAGGSFSHAPAAHSGGFGHAPARTGGGSFGHSSAPRGGAPRGGSFGGHSGGGSHGGGRHH